jgi:outer membrane immunogenic protein
MRKTILAALAGTAALAATPAFAQDGAAQNFNGPHIEAIAGYDSVNGGGDSTDGILYGIAGGYDFRINNMVLGIEAEAAESTAGDCAGGVCVDASRDLYIGGRIGAVVSPNVLVYGKVGYTNARVQVTSGNVTDGTNLDGIRAGAGVEWQFRNSPISIRAEYRYSNYEAGLDRHQGVVGLAYRF